MRSKFSILATAVAIALGSSAAGAANIEDMFSIRGYGTLGGVYSSQDKADYVRDAYAQYEGAGHTDSVSMAVDSKSALQLDVKFTERLSAVVQIVSEAMYNNSWDSDPQEMWIPSLEWANLSYRLTDSITVRGGRIVMPFLMGAEYQKVGYANHWMRNPIELYGKISYSSLDGGDAWYKHALGKGTNTIRIYGGTQDAERDAPLTPFEAKMYGIIDTYEIGSLTVRAAYQRTQIGGSAANAQPFQMLAGAFAMVGANAAAAQANELARVSSDGPEVEFATIGVSYDTGSWFAMGEVFDMRGSTLIPEHTSAYISGGFRHNALTPYGTIATTAVDEFDDGIPTTEFGGPLAELGAAASGVNAAIQAGGAIGYQDQTSVSLGVRWDVHANVAVKAQYDHIVLPGKSTGLFTNIQDGFEPGKDASVFGLSVDFVF